MKLKPCPFCGGELQTLGENHYYAHLTNDCILQHLCFEVDDKESIEAWNRRKPLEDIVEQLEEKADEANDKWTAYGKEDDYFDGKEDGIRDAIEIVKGGVVDENSSM